MPHRAVGEEAVSSTIAYAVAGLVVVLAVGGLLLAVRDNASPIKAGIEEPAGQKDSGAAQSLLDVLIRDDGADLDDTGTAAFALDEWNQPSTTCVGNMDLAFLDRVGLANEDTPGLDPCKVRNLQLSPGSGRVTYEQARAGLGLDDQRLGFHVRTIPRLDPAAFDAAGNHLLPAVAMNLDHTVNGTSGVEAWDVLYVGGSSNDTDFRTDVYDRELGVLADLVDSVKGWTGREINNSTANQTQFEQDLLASQVLVVGTGADHGELASFALDVATFVEARGGTLVVLGTDLPSNAWLGSLTPDPTTSSRSIRTADPSHPLLLAPNSLAASAYAPFQFPQLVGTAGPALDTIVEDGTGAALIRVSRTGSLGSGQVIFARVNASDPLGARPATYDHDQDPMTPQEPLPPGVWKTPETVRLFHNLLVRHQQDLFLDFGAPEPKVGSVSRATGWTVMDLGPSCLDSFLRCYYLPNPLVQAPDYSLLPAPIPPQQKVSVQVIVSVFFECAPSDGCAT